MKGSNLKFIGAIAFVGAILLAGCRKKGDTIAIIHVVDSQNSAVADARVVLKGVPSDANNSSTVTVYDTAYTNSAGEARFNFNDVYQLGQAGVAVLDIDVLKGVQTATGIIKVEQEKTTEETVYL